MDLYHTLIYGLICLIQVESLRLRQWRRCCDSLNVYIYVLLTRNYFNFDQYGNSIFQVFLQSDQAGRDNSAQKFKNTDKLAVFDYFGIVKCKIFGSSGGFTPLDPHQRFALYSLGGFQCPQTPSGLGMTYSQCTDWANTFFICILAGSYDFCRVVRQGS